MTEAELELLKSNVDQVVALEIARETVLAQVLFVFTGEENPDVFYREMMQAEDGSLVPVSANGRSTLLAEITAVRPFPEA